MASHGSRHGFPHPMPHHPSPHAKAWTTPRPGVPSSMPLDERLLRMHRVTHPMASPDPRRGFPSPVAGHDLGHPMRSRGPFIWTHPVLRRAAPAVRGHRPRKATQGLTAWHGVHRGLHHKNPHHPHGDCPASRGRTPPSRITTAPLHATRLVLGRARRFIPRRPQRPHRRRARPSAASATGTPRNRDGNAPQPHPVNPGVPRPVQAVVDVPRPTRRPLRSTRSRPRARRRRIGAQGRAKVTQSPPSLRRTGQSHSQTYSQHSPPSARHCGSVIRTLRPPHISIARTCHPTTVAQSAAENDRLPCVLSTAFVSETLS